MGNVPIDHVYCSAQIDTVDVLGTQLCLEKRLQVCLPWSRRRKRAKGCCVTGDVEGRSRHLRGEYHSYYNNVAEAISLVHPYAVLGQYIYRLYVIYMYVLYMEVRNNQNNIGDRIDLYQ